MLQLLKNPNFDFMSRRNLLLGVSALLVGAAVVVLAIQGLNLGIEFTGGTEVQIKYAERPDLADVRSTLSGAGIERFAVTTIGDPQDNEVYIRVGSTTEAEDEDDATSAVVSALLGPGTGAPDLNAADAPTLQRLLLELPEMGGAEAAALAKAIVERRTEVAIFHDAAELADLPGMSSEIQGHLEQRLSIGPLAVRSQSYIGPAIGEELSRKAGLAILGSLVGMLLYIWIRFQLQWGFAAVIALTHDTLLTLGLFALFGKEMSLPVIAAFLTLVGYSVNDTVVVFDRIRENLHTQPGGKLESVINQSINQTLSRTVITSGLTLVVVLGLLLFGGAALNPFAFVLTVGVIVGTYSSIYIASPILVLWKRFVGTKRSDQTTGPAPESERRAKKVRTTAG